MYKLSLDNNWGDTFSYNRAREIHMANYLGHSVALNYSGADAIDQDGGGSLDLDEFRQMCGIAEDIAQVAQEMFEADSDDEWDEEEEAELRNRLNKLVENKLNLAHKAARERMKNGTLDERLDAVMALFEECDEDSLFEQLKCFAERSKEMRDLLKTRK